MAVVKILGGYLEIEGGGAVPPSAPPGIWGPTDPRPGYGLPGNQPGIWPGPGPLPHPSHPIAPGGRPPGTWGGAGEPFPGYGLPGQQPPAGSPPGTWGGSGEPFPGYGLPKPEEPIEAPVTWKAVWHPTEGWVVVGLPNVPHPAPAEEA